MPARELDTTTLDIVKRSEFITTMETYIGDLTAAIQSLDFARVAYLRDDLRNRFFLLVASASLDDLQSRVDQFINTYLVDVKFPQKGNVLLPFFILEKLNLDPNIGSPVHYEDLSSDPQILPIMGNDGKIGSFGKLTKAEDLEKLNELDQAINVDIFHIQIETTHYVGFKQSLISDRCVIILLNQDQYSALMGQHQTDSGGKHQAKPELDNQRNDIHLSKIPIGYHLHLLTDAGSYFIFRRESGEGKDITFRCVIAPDGLEIRGLSIRFNTDQLQPNKPVMITNVSNGADVDGLIPTRMILSGDSNRIW